MHGTGVSSQIYGQGQLTKYCLAIGLGSQPDRNKMRHLHIMVTINIDSLLC
jgi:hypothetical protein